MKYIDYEKLIAEIRKLLIPTVHDRDYDEWEHGRDSGFIEAISIIESLQQEQPEVDEDFFFDEILKVYDGNNKYPPRSEEESTMLETVARHFYELGKNARKEE